WEHRLPARVQGPTYHPAPPLPRLPADLLVLPPGEKKPMAALRAVLSLPAAPPPAQELLSDAKLGIKLKAPDGYTRVPLKPDEEWIAARWISPRSYYQNAKSGFSLDHKPEPPVVAFPSAKVKERLEEQKSGTGEQSKT